MAQAQNAGNAAAAQNPAVNDYHIIQNMPKYSGGFPAQDWLDEFNYERQVYNRDTTWTIRNLHRVLEDTPRTWWLSQKAGYLRRLAQQGADANALWDEVMLALRGFFSTNNIKEKAKAENISIKFAVGQDPMEYVAKKIDCLSRIDPDMEMEDKIKNLLLGLPENLRALVSPADMNSIDAFFRQLTRQLNINKKILSKPSKSSERQESFSLRGMSSRTFRSQTSQSRPRQNSPRKMQRIPGLKVPRYDDEHRRQCVDDEGKKLCWHCKRPGHFVFMCYKLAQEQGLQIPTRNNNQRRVSVQLDEESEN